MCASALACAGGEGVCPSYQRAPYDVMLGVE